MSKIKLITTVVSNLSPTILRIASFHTSRTCLEVVASLFRVWFDKVAVMKHTDVDKSSQHMSLWFAHAFNHRLYIVATRKPTGSLDATELSTHKTRQIKFRVTAAAAAARTYTRPIKMCLRMHEDIGWCVKWLLFWRYILRSLFNAPCNDFCCM